MEQQQLQTSAPVVPVKLTPEQEEEIKLKIKYPNPQKPGGSAFIQKMLHKGNKKYFDSGDYNMAKSKNKALINNLNSNINNTNVTTIQQQNQQTPNININDSSNNDQNHLPNVDATLSPATNDFNQSNPVIIDSRTTTPSSTSISNLNAGNETIISTNLNNLNNQSPSLNNSHQHQQHQQHLLNAQTTPLAASPMLSNSISTSMLSNPNFLNANQMSSSVSTASIQMLSSSISTEKLSNIQINTNPTNLLDCEEIGVGIPTPECLPQSRKHSIVQSKLATPRLSTS